MWKENPIGCMKVKSEIIAKFSTKDCFWWKEFDVGKVLPSTAIHSYFAIYFDIQFFLNEILPGMFKAWAVNSQNLAVFDRQIWLSNIITKQEFGSPVR